MTQIFQNKKCHEYKTPLTAKICQNLYFLASLDFSLFDFGKQIFVSSHYIKNEKDFYS